MTTNTYRLKLFRVSPAMKFWAGRGDSAKIAASPQDREKNYHQIPDGDSRIFATTEQSRLSRNRTGAKTFVLPIIHKPGEISRMPHLILGHHADKLRDRDD